MAFLLPLLFVGGALAAPVPSPDLQSLVDKARSSGAKEVLLPGGTYRLTSPLKIGPGGPFRLASRPGQEAVLKGSAALGPWRVRPDGRWEASPPAGVTPEQLFINGQRRLRPSWPSQGHLFIERGVGRQDSFFLAPGAVPSDFGSIAGVEAVITHSWGISRIPTKSLDSASGEVVLSGKTWHPELAELKPGVWLRLDNAPIKFMREGEWRWEPGIRNVVYQPKKGEAPAKTLAETPVLTSLIELDGAKSLRLEGLTLAHTSWSIPAEGRSFYQAEADLPGAINAKNCEDIRMEGLLITGTGGYGITVNEGCHRVTIANCDLHDLGAGGIRVGEMDRRTEGDPRLVQEVAIMNSRIVGGGRVHPAGIGVLILQAGKNRVESCTIRDFYYSAISVGWVWGAGWSPAKGNQIIGNRIDLIGQGVLSDMAGVYTLGESEGTVIKGNVITRVTRARYGGWGIYFDEGSRWILAEGNLAAFTEDSPFHIHYGGDNTVRGNFFAYGKNAQMQFSNTSKTGPMLIEKNTFLWKDGPLFERDPHDLTVFRDNIYWRESDPGGIAFAGGKRFADWLMREPGAKVQKAVLPGNGTTTFGASFPVPSLGASPRVKKLPPVLRTFPPAPAPPRITFSEGYESAQPGEPPSGWGRAFASQNSRAVVTEDQAFRGRRSLKFSDSGEGEEWMPHLYLEGLYPEGKMVSQMMIKRGAGASLSFEWRDTQPWYTAGPGFTVAQDGKVTVAGKEAGFIPLDVWTRAFLEYDPSKRTFLLVIGGKESGPYSLPEGFRAVRWMGFTSLGKAGSVFYVDELEVRPLG